MSEAAAMPRFSLVPAAYVALLRGSEVLLQQRLGTGYLDGYWSFSAAGHVERDESVYAAAVREAHEELSPLGRALDERAGCHANPGPSNVGVEPLPA